MALAGLVAQFLTLSADHPDDSAAEVLWKLARYFTILTNALAAVTFGLLAVRGRVVSPVWLGGVALWIAIVGVVYHLLLASTDGAREGVSWWANALVHSFAPAGAMLWWLAFAPRDGLSVQAAVLWMLWPLIYVGYALGRGQIDGIYPYFFINPVQIGWPAVGQWVVILAVAFFVAGLVQIAVARLIRR